MPLSLSSLLRRRPKAAARPSPKKRGRPRRTPRGFAAKHPRSPVSGRFVKKHHHSK